MKEISFSLSSSDTPKEMKFSPSHSLPTWTIFGDAGEPASKIPDPEDGEIQKRN